MTVPPANFQMIAAAEGVLSADEIDRLRQWCDAEAGDGALSTGVRLDGYRRSRVAWLKQEDGFGWVYDRIVGLAKGFNDRFFGFELSAINEALQVARYDAPDTTSGAGGPSGVPSEAGRYDWHTDFGVHEQARKLSISVQLSDGAEYEGGDLEFDVSTETTRVGRQKGLAIGFPSFVRHRVAPVVSGRRYSLVAWVHGPRWR